MFLHVLKVIVLILLTLGWNWFGGAAKQWNSRGNKQLFHAIWGRTSSLRRIRTCKTPNGCFYSPFGTELPVGIGWTGSSFCFPICGLPKRFTHQSQAPTINMINSCSCMHAWINVKNTPLHVTYICRCQKTILFTWRPWVSWFFQLVNVSRFFTLLFLYNIYILHIN